MLNTNGDLVPDFRQYGEDETSEEAVSSPVHSDENASTYSGLSTVEIDENGSFDRFIHTPKGTQNFLRFAENLINIHEDFDNSDRTRLVARAVIAFEDKDKDTLLQLSEKYELSLVELPNGYFYLTLGFNKPSRAISESARARALETISVKNRKHTLPENDHLTRSFAYIETFKENGFKIISNPSGEKHGKELYALWGDTFGWSLEDCTDPSLGKNDNIFAIADKDGHLIAAVLLAEMQDGIFESTEWAVLPDMRQHELIEPLLLFAHAKQVSLNPKSAILADLRHSRSLGPAIKAGMPAIPETINEYTEVSNDILTTIREVQVRNKNLLTNHVTIGDQNTLNIDAPENENLQYSQPENIDDLDRRFLRHFVLGCVQNSFFMNTDGTYTTLSSKLMELAA